MVSVLIMTQNFSFDKKLLNRIYDMLLSYLKQGLQGDFHTVHELKPMVDWTCKYWWMSCGLYIKILKSNLLTNASIKNVYVVVNPLNAPHKTQLSAAASELQRTCSNCELFSIYTLYFIMCQLTFWCLLSIFILLIINIYISLIDWKWGFDCAFSPAHKKRKWKLMWS